MNGNEAVNWSLQLFDTTVALDTNEDTEQRTQLVAVINNLLHNDFSKLLQILYRIDVDENKLKRALFESTLPAAETIADLIIERMLQKIHFRKMYKSKKKEE
ncbi:hypothetical protein H1R17_03200 [Flavobacterium sp. xlx-214]|uniref:hypothetical protein n=1 Tax=unclassified Flavobacterium TaxID=196869 RepID=UPI0013D046B9|nr:MULTISPECIES: hypothetical protein [unclassified Flavobacterium]MBA5793280.1 hypothetical protein [Flavobacterium sp. xlx-221]QMI84155.1 hypothetical protein H1R17_03200 [Flavobacterium sp. xlx-214]